MHRVAAFTIVELLVVVTIIVVLLSLLAPAMDKAVGYAMEARCLSNLHQIGIGLRMYTADYHGYFPPKYTPGTNTSGMFVEGQGVPGTTNTVSIYWWVGTAGTTAPFDAHGANERYVNPYLGYGRAGPKSPVPVASCPGDNDAVRYYDSVGTSYASNHSFSMSSLMAKRAIPPDPVVSGTFYSAIKISRVQSASRLVAGADVPGLRAGWNLAPPSPSWHREDTYALVRVDGHATMEYFTWGDTSGPDYTFDETGRE